MHNELIRKVAELMSEQTSAYSRLESVSDQLASALMKGDPNPVESLTRAGETELLRMRARLLEITFVLTNFAESRARQDEKAPLDPQSREQFEAAAKKLLESAKDFRKVALKATNLALSGSSFASACVQMCGIPPTTYRAPVLKYSEGGIVR